MIIIIIDVGYDGSHLNVTPMRNHFCSTVPLKISFPGIFTANFQKIAVCAAQPRNGFFTGSKKISIFAEIIRS